MKYMNQVIHTCKVVYGSYSGTVNIRCHEDDDIETIKAKIRKQEGLNFLAMATYQVKIIDSKFDES
jgi:hypothetical protein